MAANKAGKPATPSQAAKDDTLAVTAGSPGQAIVLDVLANDPGSARLYSLFQSPQTLGRKDAFPVVTSATLASGAVLTIRPDGTLAYLPPPDAPAGWSESFVYTARMANGTLSTASVTLSVTGNPPSLFAADDHFDATDSGIDEDNLHVRLDVLANDSPGARIHSLAQAGDGVANSVTLNSGAVATVLGDGTIALDYDANPLFFNLQGLNEGEVWRDTFRYTAQLADGRLESASVTVEVAGRNDAPVLQAVEVVTIADDGAPAADRIVEGQLAARDADAGDTARFVLAPGEDGSSPFGALALQDDGRYQFALDGAALDALQPGESRELVFQVQALDARGAASAVGQIRFHLTGAAETQATAVDDFIAAASSGLDTRHLQATLDVLGNDPAGARVVSLVQQAWGGGDPAAFPRITEATTPAGATIRINADGTIAYDAQNQVYNLLALTADERWTESFVYTIETAGGELSTARVSVEIAGLNDAPRVEPVPTVVISDAPGPAEPRIVEGQLAATDPDTGASLHFELAPGASGVSAFGSFSLDASGAYRFTLDPAALDALEGWQNATVPFYVVAVDEHGLASAAQAVWVVLVGSAEGAGAEAAGA